MGRNLDKTEELKKQFSKSFATKYLGTSKLFKIYDIS